jgi:hypothetical protein
MTKPLVLLCAVLLALTAGCGGDDDDGGGGDKNPTRTVAQAKQALVASCHKGNEGNAADLKLCRCVGDELEAKHGYSTAEKFDSARKRVEGNDVPTEVQTAVTACHAKQ